jgi:hypothetical protein
MYLLPLNPYVFTIALYRTLMDEMKTLMRIEEDHQNQFYRTRQKVKREQDTKAIKN